MDTRMSNTNHHNTEEESVHILETDLSFSSHSFQGDDQHENAHGNNDDDDDDDDVYYRDTTTCCDEHDDDEDLDSEGDINDIATNHDSSIIREIHSRENVELELLCHPQNQNQSHGNNTLLDVDNDGYIGGEDEIEGNYEDEELDVHDGSEVECKDEDDILSGNEGLVVSGDDEHDDDLSFGSSHPDESPSRDDSDVDGHVVNVDVDVDVDDDASTEHQVDYSDSNFSPPKVNQNETNEPNLVATPERNTNIATNNHNSPTEHQNTSPPPLAVPKRATRLMSLFDSPSKTNENGQNISRTTSSSTNQTLHVPPDLGKKKIMSNGDNETVKVDKFFHRQITQRFNNNLSRNKTNIHPSTNDTHGHGNVTPRTASPNRRHIISHQEESNFSTAATSSQIWNAYNAHKETDGLLQHFNGENVSHYQSADVSSLRQRPQQQQQFHDNPFPERNDTMSTKHKSKVNYIKSITSGLIGSLIFGLFHIVFCLAQASAITRPYTNRPSMGSMVRVASMGTVVATPFFLGAMLKSFPDLYPSIDVFPAPFYVKQAFIIDEILQRDHMGSEDDVFLTTFCVVTGIGLLLTGLFLVLASKFKLANLGVFLPYPVMAGFFSTVGVLIWTLAFTVDTGRHVGEVFTSHWNDFDQIRSCIIQHTGSIIVAVLMKKTAGVNNSLVPVITFITIPLSHLLLFLTGTSLEDARDDGWFWHDSDFKSTEERFQNWVPPLPFGVINGIYEGKVHWGAVRDTLPITIAMGLIYFIRCSLHVPALKKNSENIQKWREEQENTVDEEDDEIISESERMDLSQRLKVGDKQNHTMSTAEIYTAFAKVLAISGLIGGSACIPALGPSATVTQLGSSGVFPQYGSAVVLMFFYLTDFELLGYIPKVTFSSLLVLTSFKLLQDWFLKSYAKIKEKWEWAVVPLIAILSFTIGVLPSVFVGIATSTFIFVGAFYRSGVVKYIANGLTVHSTTERSPDDMKWLDIHGDLIQLVVLQNYLFFGNANSCFNYINTMFEEPSSADLEVLAFPLPPKPKYIIIDFTMVTGMDASAVDVFIDVIKLCKDNSCKVILSGLKKEIKEVFSCGGVTPSRDRKSNFSALNVYTDMDHALRKAEDALVMTVLKDEEKELRRCRLTRQISVADGFLNALQQIDSQHHMKVAEKLMDLAPYVEVVNLNEGETLGDQGCGLYFIEHGIIKVERDSSNTTRSLRQKGGLLYATPRFGGNDGSIGHLRVRTPTIARETALLKQAREFTSDHVAHTVRLARIGPGFVVGSMEVCTSSFNHHQGIHTAVVPCRLHLLSNESIREIEDTKPKLALELYKMMSQLSAERQAATIDQLATLQSIMVSLAPSKPVDRLTMAAVREAMKNIQP